MKPSLTTLFPPLVWGRNYTSSIFASDLLAAAIVTIMLIPQSLAYALLAGLPAEMGLYASILPLIVYALLGSSRTLSVGPVAVVSLLIGFEFVFFRQLPSTPSHHLPHTRG